MTLDRLKSLNLPPSYTTTRNCLLHLFLCPSYLFFFLLRSLAAISFFFYFFLYLFLSRLFSSSSSIYFLHLPISHSLPYTIYSSSTSSTNLIHICFPIISAIPFPFLPLTKTALNFSSSPQSSSFCFSYLPSALLPCPHQ